MNTYVTTLFAASAHADAAAHPAQAQTTIITNARLRAPAPESTAPRATAPVRRH